MKNRLKTEFSARQYMVSKDFELYYYEDKKPEDVPFHTHDYYEIYFFLEGHVSIEIGKKSYSVNCGDILIMPPEVPHRPIIHDYEIPYRRFVFWISQEYYQNLLTRSSDYGYIFQYVDANQDYLFHSDPVAFNETQSKILRLLEELYRNRFAKNAQLLICVDDLVLHLNRFIHEKNNLSVDREADSLPVRVLDYIVNHIQEPITLDMLAQEFYMSKYYISHEFKDALGMSIHQYISKKRLELCMESMQTGTTITESCQEFWLGDYSSFFRAFKKEYGISPKDYYNQLEENRATVSAANSVLALQNK